LTLNRPGKLNAADLNLQQQLAARVEAVAADADARVLILTGAGRAFSSGGDRTILRDIVSGTSKLQKELGEVHFATLEAFLSLSIPTIAAVNGLAIGYAAGLVALCDLVVMGESAFLSDPHAKFGIGATTAVQLIWPRLTSAAIARELMMFGREVGAEEALRIGLANRVTPPGKELAMALEMAETLAAQPRAGLATIKHAFNEPLLAEIAALKRIAQADGSL
jgi:enoyl-CoA hydratase/carnithine racemase